MHCRDISEAEFETIAAELVNATTQGDDIEVVTGNHEDHGEVIMIRDATRYMVLVDDLACLDLMQTGGGLSAEGAILRRVMRAGADGAAIERLNADQPRSLIVEPASENPARRLYGVPRRSTAAQNPARSSAARAIMASPM